ncbi:MAG: methyltransferase domain-containing protein [archaeon]
MKIQENYKRFLVKAIGKSPNKNNMHTIINRMNELNEASKNKFSSNEEVRHLYDNELSNFWEKIVAYENKGDEIYSLLKNINIKNDAKILSLASGIGVFEMFIATNILSNGEIICVDLSSKMNKKANEISKKLNLKNVKIITSSANKLSIKNSSQDIVLARRTGLSDEKIWSSVLKEVKRVMKEDSAVFVYTVQKDFCKSKKEIIKDLDSVGLKFKKIDSFKEKEGNKIMMVIAGVKI